MVRSIFRAQGSGVGQSGKFRLDTGERLFPQRVALEQAPQGGACGTKSARAPGVCGQCSWTRGGVSDTPAKCRVGHDVSFPLEILSDSHVSPGFLWGLFWSLNWAAETRQEH